MKELSDVINERDKHFKDSTIKIFVAMDLAIECIEKYLNSIDPMFEAGHFSWNDVYLEEALITILGVVFFDEGTVIDTKTGKVTITAENEEYFERVVRMALPYELVTGGNETDILEFLKKLHAEGHGEDYGEMPVEEQVAKQAEFDLTALSEDQQAALMMYNTNKRFKA